MGVGSSAKQNLLPEDGTFVINFHRATDVPKPESSDSDPYVRAYLIDSGKQFLISKVIKTNCRVDNSQPIWNCYRDFKVNPPNGSYLRCEIFNSDIMTNDKIVGHVDIPVNEYWDEEEHTFPCEFHAFGSMQTNPNFSISLRRLMINSKPPLRQVFFILRHGESKWNKAQSTRNVSEMIQFDHGLTMKGVEQAASLNRNWKSTNLDHLSEQELSMHPIDSSFSVEKLKKYYTQRFLQATSIYSSPLTRAIQTALIALQHHPALLNHGLTLYRSACHTSNLYFNMSFILA
jgi:hypothetical protein